MIRLMTCIRKKKAISYEEFRRYWEDPAFAELLNKAAGILKRARYAWSLSLQVGANMRIMESRGSDEPYEGIIEWWWESAAQLAPLLDTPQAREVINNIRAFQAHFVDFAASPSFFTEA